VNKFNANLLSKWGPAFSQQVQIMEKAFQATIGAVIINIKKVRHFKNYSQDFIAAKLQISQNAYSKLELGYSKITLDRFFQIAAILGVEESQLIRLDMMKLTK